MSEASVGEYAGTRCVVDVLIYAGRTYDEYRKPDGTTYRVIRESKTVAEREAIREARRLHEREHKLAGKKFRSMGE